jgi:hypothetical protein
MKNSVSTLIVAGFLLAYAAPAASQETPAEFCNGLADFAEAAALDRDSGNSEADMLAYIGQNIINADMRSVLSSFTHPPLSIHILRQGLLSSGASTS